MITSNLLFEFHFFHFFIFSGALNRSLIIKRQIKLGLAALKNYLSQNHVTVLNLSLDFRFEISRPK